MALLLTTLAFIGLAKTAFAKCECGYTVNSTDAQDFALFTHVLETDFVHLSPDALDWDERNATGWARQVYSLTAQASRNGGDYGRNVTAANAVINPMKSQYDWAGPSVHGGDAGLQLWARAKIRNREVSSGEVVTIRNDILYGSFRIGVKMTGVPGTCGAFFWYHNDSQEIDFEYLSYQQSPNSTSDKFYHPLNLVIQTLQSAAAGYNAAGTPDYAVVSLPFSPSSGFHELRFDWTPDSVTYYADGQWLRTMTYEIPDRPGQLFLNHWSNGNPGWSKGPPTRDAVMTVSYVKAYFNTSSKVDRAGFARNCTDRFSGRDVLEHTCRVPDQRNAPDPDGPNGNATAKTFFFTPAGVQPRLEEQSGTEPASSGCSGPQCEGKPNTGSSTPVSGSIGKIQASIVLVVLLFALAL